MSCIEASTEPDCTYRDPRSSQQNVQQTTALVSVTSDPQPPDIDFSLLWFDTGMEGFSLEPFLGPQNMRVTVTTGGERDLQL